MRRGRVAGRRTSYSTRTRASCLIWQASTPRSVAPARSPWARGGRGRARRGGHAQRRPRPHASKDAQRPGAHDRRRPTFVSRRAAHRALRGALPGPGDAAPAAGRAARHPRRAARRRGARGEAAEGSRGDAKCERVARGVISGAARRHAAGAGRRLRALQGPGQVLQGGEGARGLPRAVPASFDQSVR